MTAESPTQATPGSEVFISYASQDAAVANAIVEALERNGLRCWIAPRDVRAGAQYADAIVRAISGAKVLVLVLSANAIASSHVGKEIERASSKKRSIIALRTDAAPLTPALEYFLSESQWIEAQAGHMEAAYARLIDAIREPDRTALTSIPVVTPEASARTAPALHPKSRRNRILLATGLAVVAVTLAALWAAKFWPAKQVTAEKPTTAATTAVSDKSIAVLPFVNMSPDKDQDYFADGISEELLNLLAKVPELRVIARTSSFSFKGKEVDIAEIARKLNVANVLEGSVRKSGDMLRITAQLVRASDSSHLWSQTYDRPMTDVFKVQDEIAATVVAQLKIHLLGAAPKLRVTDPQAYALFLQARDIGRQYTKAGFEQSNTLYQRALALDPGYAAAWEGLASNYSNQAFNGLTPIEQGIRLAREATNKALTLEPAHASTFLRLSWIASQYDLDLSTAAQHMEDALALEPTNPDVLAQAGYLARRLGRLDEAIAIGEYQIGLDPMNPIGHDTLAYSYRYVGYLDDAIAALRTALALSPGYIAGHEGIGEVLLEKGDAKSALAEMRQEVVDSWRLVGLSIAHHALGQQIESDAALAELIENYAEVTSFNIAYVLAFRSEADRAFEWLDKAAQYHDLYFGAASGHPMFTKIHSDPRWLPFLRKYGMAPEQLAAVKFDVKLPQ